MKSLNVGAPNFNSPRPQTTYSNDRRVYSVLMTASLGYLSVGYHLTVFNSISVFLWQKATHDYNLSFFQSICNAVFPLGTFVVALFLAFNKVKFADYKKMLTLADILMIFGSLCAFGLVLLDSSVILLGRFVVGEAAAINVTCILSFIREAQFYLSQSDFKAEARRLFGEVSFAVGVILGFLANKLIPSVQTNTSDKYLCGMFAALPLIASFARILFLQCLGDLRSAQYAQAFTDEGLVEIDENEDENEPLYMLKFKETKSLIKLFTYPYRRRIFIGALLYILQAAAGYFIIIFDSYYLTLYFDPANNQDLEKRLFNYGKIFLAANLVLGLIFFMKKVSRKLFMYLGVLIAIAVIGYCLLNPNQDLQNLMYVFYAGVCVGLGFAVELYLEETLPAKGLQFLQSIKWLLIGGAAVLLRSTEESRPETSTILLFFLIPNVVALILMNRLVPETSKLSQTEISAIFGGQEQKGKNRKAQYSDE